MMRHRTHTIHFEKLQLRTTRSGRCSGCQKRTSRVLHVWATENPFNKNEKGLPKSRAEIMTDLRAKLEERKAKPLLCTSCER